MNSLFLETETDALKIQCEGTRIQSSDLINRVSRQIKLYENSRMVSVNGGFGSTQETLMQMARELIAFGSEITPMLDFPVNRRDTIAKPPEAFFQKMNGNELRSFLRDFSREFQAMIPEDVHLESSIRTSRRRSSLKRENDNQIVWERLESNLSISLSRNLQSELWSWYDSLSTPPESMAAVREWMGKLSRQVQQALLPAAEIPAGIYPVLIAPQATASNLIPALVSGLEPANRFNQTSPLIKRLEESILHQTLSLKSDSPYRFSDDDGLPSSSMSWIQNGVLQAFPTPHDWASRLKTDAMAANFGGGLFSDLRLESTQTHPIQELIRQMDRGVLFIDSWGMTQGNLVSGELSGLMHKAFWVENGEIQGPLKGRTLSLNLYEVWGEDYLASSEETRTFGIYEPITLPWTLAQKAQLA